MGESKSLGIFRLTEQSNVTTSESCATRGTTFVHCCGDCWLSAPCTHGNCRQSGVLCQAVRLAARFEGSSMLNESYTLYGQLRDGLSGFHLLYHSKAIQFFNPCLKSLFFYFFHLILLFPHPKFSKQPCM